MKVLLLSCDKEMFYKKREIRKKFSCFHDNTSRWRVVCCRKNSRVQCRREQLLRHIILCKGQACDIIRGGVRAQVENTRGTNYPFLHGIIAVDRDKAIRAYAVYKSFVTIAWKLVADKSRNSWTSSHLTFQRGLAADIYQVKLSLSIFMPYHVEQFIKITNHN